MFWSASPRSCELQHRFCKVEKRGSPQVVKGWVSRLNMEEIYEGWIRMNWSWNLMFHIISTFAIVCKYLQFVAEHVYDSWLYRCNQHLNELKLWQTWLFFNCSVADHVIITLYDYIYIYLMPLLSKLPLKTWTSSNHINHMFTPLSFHI